MIVYMANEFKPLSKLQVFKQKVVPTLMPIIKSLRKISDSSLNDSEIESNVVKSAHNASH
jgi:hypothetical protein